MQKLHFKESSWRSSSTPLWTLSRPLKDLFPEAPEETHCLCGIAEWYKRCTLHLRYSQLTSYKPPKNTVCHKASGTRLSQVKHRECGRSSKQLLLTFLWHTVAARIITGGQTSFPRRSLEMEVQNTKPAGPQSERQVCAHGQPCYWGTVDGEAKQHLPGRWARFLLAFLFSQSKTMAELSRFCVVFPF